MTADFASEVNVCDCDHRRVLHVCTQTALAQHMTAVRNQDCHITPPLLESLPSSALCAISASCIANSSELLDPSDHMLLSKAAIVIFWPEL